MYRVLFKFRIAFSDPSSKVIQLLIIHFNPFLVLKEKKKKCCHGNPLVAVLERVILYHEIKENGRLFEKSRIQMVAPKGLERRFYTSLQRISVSCAKVGDRFRPSHCLFRQAMRNILYIGNVKTFQLHI